MTTTTTTAKATTIPATGLRFETATTVVTARYINGAGYKVEVRIDGEYQPQMSSLHTFEDGRDGALAAYNGIVAGLETPAEVEAPTAHAEVKAIPGNTGRRIRVSNPSHFVLAVASIAHDGVVEQGGQLGQATVAQLRSLARKGYLTLIPKQGGPTYAISGGRITTQGRKRLAELTAADRENALREARLAVVESIQIAA